MLSLAARAKILDNAEFLRRLHAVGEERRANILHRNLSSDSDRMQGELMRHGHLMTPNQRSAVLARAADLARAAARAHRSNPSDPGGHPGVPHKKKHAKT